jgi:hypothetical protein
MPETCTIKNQTKRPLVLNLPHGIVPEHASMGITGTLEYMSESGERKVRAHRHPISGSITLFGGESAQVAASAKHAPDVQAAHKRGEISITDDVAAPVAPPAPTTAPPGAPTLPPADDHVEVVVDDKE